MNLPETAKLQEIYGETEISGARFKNLADNFSKIYGQDKAEYFTAPGRTCLLYTSIPSEAVRNCSR